MNTENNKLIAEFMNLKPIKMATNCCSCDTELKVGSDIRYDKNYNAYCNNGECSDSISTIGETIIEPCWFDGDTNIIDIETLKYDSDWNSLILVVEKIESLGFDVRIRKDDCVIYYNTDKRDEVVLYVEHEKGKLLSTYQAVIEFIKWYNGNK